MTTLQKEHRAKRETLGLESLKEQRRELSATYREQKASIAEFKTIRAELTTLQLELLYEFKSIGSPGATAAAVADVIKLSRQASIKRCSDLKTMGLLEPTGFLHERSHMLRINRKGVNVLQSR